MFCHWRYSSIVWIDIGEEISTVGGRSRWHHKSLSTIKQFCDSDMSHRIQRWFYNQGWPQWLEKKSIENRTPCIGIQRVAWCRGKSMGSGLGVWLFCTQAVYLWTSHITCWSSSPLFANGNNNNMNIYPHKENKCNHTSIHSTNTYWACTMCQVLY